MNNKLKSLKDLISKRRNAVEVSVETCESRIDTPISTECNNGTDINNCEIGVAPEVPDKQVIAPEQSYVETEVPEQASAPEVQPVVEESPSEDAVVDNDASASKKKRRRK